MKKKNEKKNILYKIWNIFKNKAPIGKRSNRLWEEPSMYHH